MAGDLVSGSQNLRRAVADLNPAAALLQVRWRTLSFAGFLSPSYRFCESGEMQRGDGYSEVV